MHAFTSASTRSPPRFTPKQCSIVRIHSWETSARRAALGEQGQGLPNPGGCHIRVQHTTEPDPTAVASMPASVTSALSPARARLAALPSTSIALHGEMASTGFYSKAALRAGCAASHLFHALPT